MDSLKGLAHITGGGLIDNVPRIIPDGLMANIKISWPLSELYSWIMHGGITHSQIIPQDEMLRIFNCGIGMVLILDKKEVVLVQDRLRAYGHDVYEIGKITKTKSKKKIKITGELK